MNDKQYAKVVGTLHQAVYRQTYDTLFEHVVLPSCGSGNTTGTPLQYAEDVFSRIRSDGQLYYMNALVQIVSAEIEHELFIAGNNQIRRYGVLMNDERADYPDVKLTIGEAEMIKHWCDNREYWSERFIGIVEVR